MSELLKQDALNAVSQQPQQQSSARNMESKFEDYYRTMFTEKYIQT